MKFEYGEMVSQATRSGARHTGPSFTAYEMPADRVPRLTRTYAYAQDTVRRMSTAYQNSFDGAVMNLHDHKGVMEITWRDHDARVMFEGVMAGAWEKSGEPIVEHHLAKAPR